MKTFPRLDTVAITTRMLGRMLLVDVVFGIDLQRKLCELWTVLRVEYNTRDKQPARRAIRLGIDVFLENIVRMLTDR